jgi:hypothetical protein
MQGKVDQFYNSLDEPSRSCLLFLRNFILNFSSEFEERRKNNTPFYYYKGKWFGFISYHPKTKVIYFSFVNGHLLKHDLLKSEGRKKMKIFYVDPSKDIDIKSLGTILNQALFSVDYKK